MPVAVAEAETEEELEATKAELRDTWAENALLRGTIREIQSSSESPELQGRSPDAASSEPHLPPAAAAFLGDSSAMLHENDVTVVAEGFEFTDAPLYVEEEKALYFSDIASSRLFKHTYEHAVQLVHSTEANESAIGINAMVRSLTDPQEVFLCQPSQHRVVKAPLSSLQPGCTDLARAEVVATSFEGKAFRSPGASTVSPLDGALWFTDSIHFLEDRDHDSAGASSSSGALQSIGFQGVFRVQHGVLRLATAMHRRPNGLAFSPDGKTLYVADGSMGAPSWTVYPVDQEDQSLGKATSVINEATLGCRLGHDSRWMAPHEALHGREGVAGGCAVDEDGLLWASIPNGVAVINPQEKEVIMQVVLGASTSAVAFGTGRDVWITGSRTLWRLQRITPADKVAQQRHELEQRCFQLRNVVRQGRREEELMK